MPCTCIILDCKSRSNRDNVGYFAVPTVLNHRFATHKNELSKVRRDKWIAAIKRPDTLDLIKYQRVCGRHFISGKPANLEEVDHPDWVPTQNLGHSSGAFKRKPISLARYERLAKRKEKKEPSYCAVKKDIAPFVKISSVPEKIEEIKIDKLHTPTIKTEDSSTVMEESSPNVCDSPPKTLHYENCCRACLKRVDVNLNIFEYMLQDQNVLIAEALRTALPPEIVQEDDKLPHRICGDCLMELSRVYAFIKKCLQTHETLMSSLSDNENAKMDKSDTEELITIINEEFVVKEDDAAVELKTEQSVVEVCEEEKTADFNCEMCRNVSFSKKEELMKHLLSVHEEFTKPYKCDKCEKRFALEENWVRHQVIHTSKEYEESCQKPKKSVDVDQQPKSAKKQPDMTDFLPPEPTYRWFMCEQCGKKYKYEFDLNQHLSTSHASLFSKANSQTDSAVDDENRKRVETFLCDDCGRVLRSKKALKLHKQTHTGVKPHQCEHCGKTFAQLSTLIGHRRTHTGERPYSCGICKKKFGQSCHLRLHRRIHTGEKPYSCSFCGKKFAWKMNWSVHLKIHTGEKSFACGVCDETFVTANARKNHLVKYHESALILEEEEIKTPTTVQ